MPFPPQPPTLPPLCGRRPKARPRC